MVGSEGARGSLILVGCGKMGRLIEQLAPECGFDVRAKFTRADNLHVAGITSEL